MANAQLMDPDDPNVLGSVEATQPMQSADMANGVIDDNQTPINLGTITPNYIPTPSEPMLAQNTAPQQAQPKMPGEGFALQGPVGPEQTKQYLMQQDQAWANDLQNGHITPETYQSLFAKKDTLGKIGSIFGLILGGAGSGLSGQPNAALDTMNKIIQNDLDAQKASKANAHNFIKLNEEHQLNLAREGLYGAQSKLSEAMALKTADATTKMMMNRAALDYLVKMPQFQNDPKFRDAVASVGNAVDLDNINIPAKVALLHGILSSGSTTGQAPSVPGAVAPNAIQPGAPAGQMPKAPKEKPKEVKNALHMPGVDHNRVNTLTTLSRTSPTGDVNGIIKGEDVDPLNKESALVKENRGLAADYVDAVEDLNEGYTKGINPLELTGRIATINNLAKRSNGLIDPIDPALVRVKNLTNNNFPMPGDTQASIQKKFKTTLDNIKAREAGVTKLKSYNVYHEFPDISLKSSQSEKKTKAKTPAKLSGQDAAAKAWADKNPKDPRAAKILERLNK